MNEIESPFLRAKKLQLAWLTGTKATRIAVHSYVRSNYNASHNKKNLMDATMKEEDTPMEDPESDIEIEGKSHIEVDVQHVDV